MTESEIAAVEAEVAELIGDRQTVSPYRLASLASILMGRYVREQLVYSYVRQNLIVGSKNADGKWQVSAEQAAIWLNKYVRRNR